MVLRRIGVWSTARMAGAINAVIGLIIGLLFAMFSVIGGLAAAAGEDASGLLGAVFGVGAIVLMPIFYGCMGLIGGAISAALYNVFSGMVGGIELELQPPPAAATRSL